MAKVIRRFRALVGDRGGRQVQGKNRVAAYSRDDFSKHPDLDWFRSTVDQVRANLAPEFLPAAIAISRIEVFEELRSRANRRADWMPRHACVTYGEPRVLYITRAATVHRLLRFEEVAHSLDYRCRLSNWVNASIFEDSEPDDVADAYTQMLSSVPSYSSATDALMTMPLRCHVAIYEAFHRLIAPMSEADRIHGELDRTNEILATLRRLECRLTSRDGKCQCHI